MEIQELPGITRFIPKILLALTVTVCDEVYKKIAYWLNDMGKRPAAVFLICGLIVGFGCVLMAPECCRHCYWNLHHISFFVNSENYRLQSDYENNLIIKMVFVSHVFGFFFKEL